MFNLTNDKKIILASGSPRRKELLKKAGFNPVISPSDIDEKIPEGLEFKEVVMYLALQKALAKESEILTSGKNGDLIIGADTVVAFNGKILGKPHDYDEAFSILNALKNNTHYVATGVAILECGTYNREIFVSITEVIFKNYTDADIAEYLSTDEPWDKAGSYAIQGLWGKQVADFRGDYDNIVGLPVSLVVEKIKCL